MAVCSRAATVNANAKPLRYSAAVAQLMYSDFRCGLIQYL